MRFDGLGLLDLRALSDLLSRAAAADCSSESSLAPLFFSGFHCLMTLKQIFFKLSSVGSVKHGINTILDEIEPLLFLVLVKQSATPYFLVVFPKAPQNHSALDNPSLDSDTRSVWGPSKTLTGGFALNERSPSFPPLRSDDVRLGPDRVWPDVGQIFGRIGLPRPEAVRLAEFGQPFLADLSQIQARTDWSSTARVSSPFPSSSPFLSLPQVGWTMNCLLFFLFIFHLWLPRTRDTNFCMASDAPRVPFSPQHSAVLAISKLLLATSLAHRTPAPSSSARSPDWLSGGCMAR